MIHSKTIGAAFIILCAASLLSLTAQAGSGIPLLTQAIVDEVSGTFGHDKTRTDTYTGKACVAKGHCFEFTFDISSDGHGMLRLPGAAIRAYDNFEGGQIGQERKDGQLKPPGLFPNELVDANNDGYKDLKMGRLVFQYLPETGCFKTPIDPFAPIFYMRTDCAAQKK